VDYNPLKSMLVLISSLRLSTVPYAADSESRGQTASQVSLFVGFLISWSGLPTKKSDFTVVVLI